MLLLGRSPFGTVAYTGEILASGSAVGEASVRVSESALRPAQGSVSCGAQARAEAVRNVNPVPKQVDIRSGASVAEVAHYALGGDAATASSAKARAVAEFAGQGQGSGAASVTGSMHRIMRMRRAGQALATASMEAEAYAYVYVLGRRAWARALPFATYWYVGQGRISAGAVCGGEAQRIRSSTGASRAVGTIQPNAQVDSNGSGGAQASVQLDSDPQLVIDGVIHKFGLGHSRATAEATAKPYVYTVDLAVGRARLSATPNVRRPNGGHVVARVTGQGRLERVLPFESSVVVGAEASGSASLRLAAFGRVDIDAVGCVATAQATLNAKAQVSTRSFADAEVARLAIEIRPGTAEAKAEVEPAEAIRNVLVAARPVGRANVRGMPRSLRAGFGKSAGVAAIWAGAGLHPKLTTSGEALASATVLGSNRVNETGQFLSQRLLVVGAANRSISLSPSYRTVKVGVSRRELAA